MAFFSVMQVAAARLYFVFVNKTFNLHRRQRIVVISTLVASFFAQKNVIQNANSVMVFFFQMIYIDWAKALKTALI